jgi:hypothetical protein
MIVKALDFSSEEEVKKWDDFVIRFGQIYHHSNWARVLSSVYKFKPFYLYVERDGEIISIFPLFYVRLPVIRDELVSIPHLEACGIINTEYYSLYFDHIYANIRPQTLRIYQFKEPINDFNANTSEVILILELPDKEEDILPHITSEPTRRNIRRALEQEYEVVTGDNEELLRHFYRLYLLKMKEFGTPPHGFNFMKCIADTYSDNCVILVIRFKDEYAAAGFYIQFNECLYNLYFAVPDEFLREKTGYILEYTSMKIAVERSLKYIVRGRSTKGSGTYLYKLRLGGSPEQLYIYDFTLTSQGYEALEAKTIKEKYRLAPKAWSVMPHFFTNNIGPFVRKWLY